jgi:hypothetical protein
MYVCSFLKGRPFSRKENDEGLNVHRTTFTDIIFFINIMNISYLHKSLQRLSTKWF